MNGGERQTIYIYDLYRHVIENFYAHVRLNITCYEELIRNLSSNRLKLFFLLVFKRLFFIHKKILPTALKQMI